MADMDLFDAAEQPRCPECGVVMRDVPGGWQCPSCGHANFPKLDRIVIPPPFRGPSIHGG